MNCSKEEYLSYNNWSLATCLPNLSEVTPDTKGKANRRLRGDGWGEGNVEMGREGVVADEQGSETGDAGLLPERQSR